MTLEERRQRALRIKQRDAVAFKTDEFSAEEKAEDAKLLAELEAAKKAEVEEEEDVHKKLPPGQLARLKQHAKKLQDAKSGANWVDMDDTMDDVLSFAQNHTESMNDWEQSFVESVSDFASHKNGMTARQWSKLQDIVKRYHYRF